MNFILMIPEIVMIVVLIKNNKVSIHELCVESFRAFGAYLSLVFLFTIQGFFSDYSSLLIGVSIEELFKILFFCSFNKEKWNIKSAILFGSVFAMLENIFIPNLNYQILIPRMFTFFTHSVFLLIYIMSYRWLKNKSVKGALIFACALGILSHILFDIVVEGGNVVTFSFVNALFFEIFIFAWRKEVKNQRNKCHLDEAEEIL